MAFVNTNGATLGFHGLFESSRLKATDVGRIHDTLVVNVSTSGSGNDAVTTITPIAVDNGVGVKIGDFVGEDLQQIYATIAAVGDKIAVVGTDPVVKDACTKAKESPVYFTNKAGKISRSYEVLNDSQEIFAVADYQFTDASVSAIKVGNYVRVDGNGMWVAQASAPAAATYGFIGKIHSIAADSLGQYKIVRIQCIQNVQK